MSGVRKLEDAGSDLIITTCNTVHEYYDYLQKQVHIPIFNIIEETKKRVVKAGYTTVGLFSSDSTNKLKLYQKSFLQSGITVLSTDERQQKELNTVIEHVMGGTQGDRDIIIFKEIARYFITRGAQAVVMGCTEIPLAINQTHTDIKLFDTIRIIVECAVDYSLGKRKS